MDVPTSSVKEEPLDPPEDAVELAPVNTKSTLRESSVSSRDSKVSSSIITLGISENIDEDDDEDFEDSEAEGDHIGLEEQEGDSADERRQDPDIVYENTLKHRSFFETAKNRRRRHLKNRLRGTIPALHFTGTKKTELYRKYGVNPEDIVEQGSIQGVDTVLTEDELKKLKSGIERRIHINGQKFKIVSNLEYTDSLYRAICHAVGLSERDYVDVDEIIKMELAENWQLFCKDVCLYGGKSSLPAINPSICSPKIMLDRYKHLLNNNPNPITPEFELRAAALHYGFTFAVVEINGTGQAVTVFNCQDEHVLKNGSVKYYFLKTGETLGCYEFLLPIGPLKKISDGVYPLILRDVIIVEQYRPWRSAEQTELSRYRPPMGPSPICFGIDHRVFFHRSTVSHDLWSLLAEVMFKKLIHAPQIKSRVIDSKHNFALYYFACKAKKRYQVNGNASIERMAEDFSKRFSKENPRGDLEDLAQAAAYFDFSYTIIGLDSGMNFHWRDYVSQHEVRKENGPYLAFFVKTLEDKTMFWYALEDVGRSCPKERKLYQDVQAGDLSAWKGKFYFHYPPKLHPAMKQEPSFTNPLFRVPTQVIFRASKWATKSYARIRSTVMTSLSSAAFKTKSLVKSFLDFIHRIRSRRKVKPDKKVEELYVRENP